MKKIILNLLFFAVVYLITSCGSESTKSQKESQTVRYCFDLKLIDGSFVKDTFNLYKNTSFMIDTYKGGYGLRITPQSLYDLYGYAIINEKAGFLKFGVIDYKNTNIIYENTDNWK